MGSVASSWVSQTNEAGQAGGRAYLFKEVECFDTAFVFKLVGVNKE